MPVIMEKISSAGEIDRKITPARAAALAANNLKTLLRRRYHTVVVVGGLPASGKSTLIINALEQDKGVLFFEGLLLSKPKRMDFLQVFRPICRARLLWIDVPKEVALQRNLTEGRGSAWTNAEMESAIAAYNPPTAFEGWADFAVINGEKSVEELVETCLNFCDD